MSNRSSASDLTCVSYLEKDKLESLSDQEHSDIKTDDVVTPTTLDNVEVTVAPPVKPYSVFSTRTKWLVAGLAGVVAIFSPISSNCFVPAIPVMAMQFHRTEADISLAVTTYLICQAVTPSFFGAASDSFGRRPILMLTLVIYIAANIGLAVLPTSEYWALLLLRAIQSTGGSAGIAIGAGAVSDIATPRERGKYMAMFQSGAMIGPAIGPFFGGMFAELLGWRSIFIFLTIFAACVLVPFLFLYPETLRSLVGDGSIPPPTLNASPIMLWQRRKQKKLAQATDVELEEPDRPPRKPFNPLSALFVLFNPEVFLIIVFVSFPYLEFYCVLTILSTALKKTYNMNNELIIGLCYLPSGVGSILSAQLSGRLQDYYYKREERRVGGDHWTKPDFRLDLTRIRCLWPFVLLHLTAAIALGWCLQAKAPLAVTLIMSFGIGLGTSTNAGATVYAQDCLPGRGGACSAAGNLVRCAFAAVGVAFIQQIYNALGAGWTFMCISGAVLCSFPLSFLVIYKAPKWRAARLQKAEQKAQRKASEVSPQVKQESKMSWWSRKPSV